MVTQVIVVRKSLGSDVIRVQVPSSASRYISYWFSPFFNLRVVRQYFLNGRVTARKKAYLSIRTTPIILYENRNWKLVTLTNVQYMARWSSQVEDGRFSISKRRVQIPHGLFWDVHCNLRKYKF